MYMSFNFFFLNIFLHQIIAKEINKLKFQELNEVSPGSENSTDGTFPNTQLFVKWDNWSCCSACCCPKSLCGQLATADKCNSVKSVKHRRGHFTLKRLADTGNRELENLFKSANEARLIEAMKINGIEKKLHDSKLALIKKLGVSSETQLVFQILDCKDDIQKKDCWELATCRFGTSNMLPEKEIATIVERDVCENATIFVLRDAHNILSLQSDKLYRLQIDRTIGDGNIVSANFTYQGKKVEKLTHLNDCLHQSKRVFQHPNGEDLILRLSREQLSKNPKINAVISYQNPARLEIVVDIVLQTKKRVKKTAPEEEYFAIILIVSLAICSLIILGLSLLILR